MEDASKPDRSGTAPATLFSSDGCPFAHRVRALVAHLEHPVEIREESLTFKSADLRRLSPTGKVPLWVEPNGSVVSESRVINEHLALAHGWSGWHPDPDIAARQRLAATQFDAVVVPALFYRPVQLYPLRLRGRSDARAVADWLTLLAEVVPHTEPRSHLGLNLAPFWVRFRWLSFLIGAEAELRRGGVGEWLDRAAALPEVQATRPDRSRYIRRYRRMQWLALAAGCALAVAAVGIAYSTILRAWSFL